MAGLVAAEGLVGREGFVANGALVREIQGRRLGRRVLLLCNPTIGGGVGAATATG